MHASWFQKELLGAISRLWVIVYSFVSMLQIDRCAPLFVFPFRSDCTSWFTVRTGGAEKP
jgi:hypothetical protein